MILNKKITNIVTKQLEEILRKEALGDKKARNLINWLKLYQF